MISLFVFGVLMRGTKETRPWRPDCLRDCHLVALEAGVLINKTKHLAIQKETTAGRRQRDRLRMPTAMKRVIRFSRVCRYALHFPPYLAVAAAVTFLPPAPHQWTGTAFPTGARKAERLFDVAIESIVISPVASWR